MQNNLRNSTDTANRWVILAATVPILALVMGQLVNGLSVYFVPLEAEFGWDRADIALINSLGLVLAFGYMGHGLGGWQGGFFYDLTSAYTWTYAKDIKQDSHGNFVAFR